MDYLRSDAMFMEILQERKTITGFLDAVFGFLRRNTDFYHVKKNANEKIGFAKGLREQILFNAMQSYDPEHKINNLNAMRGEAEGEYAPPAVEEVEIASEEVEMEQEGGDSISKGEPETFEKVTYEAKSADGNFSATDYKNGEVEIASEEVEMEQEGGVDSISKVEPETFEKITNEAKSADSIFAVTDYKNGACFQNYCWSQSLRDVDLHIKLPTNLSQAKQLSIDINADEISVRSRSDPSNVIIGGKIKYRFKHNDAVWTISEGKLSISLDKSAEIWWEQFFSTEDLIDTKKIDCERYIDELPEDTQAEIHKLRVQQMEADNLNKKHTLTESESETMKRLRTAWDVEGSPFKGQPFDPSMVKLN